MTPKREDPQRPLAFYGLADLEPGYSHRFVTFPWAGTALRTEAGTGNGTGAGNRGRLSVHVFPRRQASDASVSARREGAPPPGGTVLLLHGYLDHALVNGRTIRLLVEAGYDVVAPDLPGHGLSDGEEAGVDDFRTYAEALRCVLAEADAAAESGTPATPGPLSVVGHSAGAAAVLAYCNRYGSPFASVVFVAPLVRTVGWRAIKVALPILRLFSRRIFRRKGACSSDRDFVSFHQADPRMAKTASLEWSRAMVDWEARLENYTRFPDSVVAIQGTKDSVVSWRHNLRFLRRKIPGMSVNLIPGGMHCLLNEREELRRRVEALILDALDPPWPGAGVPAALDLSRVPGYEVPMSKEKWNRRYAERDADSPGEPNPVVVEETAPLRPGRALDLAAGDGRHALFLAARGWRVACVDFSQAAVERGRRFAAAAGLGPEGAGGPGGETGSIDWVHADLAEYEPASGAFDLVTILFLHIPWNEMQDVIRKGAAALAPGGTFLLLGHHRDNIGRGAGGPQDPDVLYTEEAVAKVLGGLDGLDIERQEKIERHPKHAGEATGNPEALALDCLVKARRPLSRNHNAS